jgi:hypothetical protein
MAPWYIRHSITELSLAGPAGRDAVAILAMAPLAAAVSVSPAPLTDTEELCARLVVTSRNGSACTHVLFGPRLAAKTRVPAIPAQFCGSRAHVARAAGNSNAVGFE